MPTVTLATWRPLNGRTDGWHLEIVGIFDALNKFTTNSVHQYCCRRKRRTDE